MTCKLNYIKIKIDKLSIITTSVILLLIGFGAYLIAIQVCGNIGVVVKDELYRSNQPDADLLLALKKQYGINTIINLRGESVGSKWYDQEVNLAKILKIDHIDFEMSANHQLGLDEIDHLITMMKNAAKPILIHCKSGSDRSGLAAALYLAAISGENAELAQQQLSIIYGHFGIPLSSTYAMDRSFDDFIKRSSVLLNSSQDR